MTFPLQFVLGSTTTYRSKYGLTGLRDISLTTGEGSDVLGKIARDIQRSPIKCDP